MHSCCARYRGSSRERKELVLNHLNRVVSISLRTDVEGEKVLVRCTIILVTVTENDANFRHPLAVPVMYSCLIVSLSQREDANVILIIISCWAYDNFDSCFYLERMHGIWLTFCVRATLPCVRGSVHCVLNHHTLAWCQPIIQKRFIARIFLNGHHITLPFDFSHGSCAYK